MNVHLIRTREERAQIDSALIHAQSGVVDSVRFDGGLGVDWLPATVEKSMNDPMWVISVGPVATS